MKNKIPEWFWRLLPVLCGRQSAADFEQWLYREAENGFPENVYQGLLWLDYREVAENPLLIVDWISGERFFDDDADDAMHEAVVYLQNGEHYRGWVRQDKDWLNYFPLSYDYIEKLKDYLCQVAYEHDVRHCWDEAANDNFLSALNAEQNRFLGELCFALARQTPPPPVPEIPPALISGSLKSENPRFATGIFHYLKTLLCSRSGR